MKQRLLCFLLAGCLLLNCVLTARADDATVVDSGACGDTVTWTLDSDGLLKIEGSGEMAGYDDSSPPWGSHRSEIYTVQIGDGVTSLGSYAFLGCANLTSVVLSDSIGSIAGCAFYHCTALTSVTIPVGVTDIIETAFLGCSALENIEVDESNQNYSSLGGVLFDKNRETLVQYPKGKSGAYAVPDGVTVIGYQAFESCGNLTGVTIADSVTTIEGRAFANCANMASVTMGRSVSTIGDEAFESCNSLADITIPESVTSIGNRAFASMYALESITVDENNRNYSSLDGVLFDKNRETLIKYPGKNSGPYVVPDGVVVISSQAFEWEWVGGLTGVTIADSVTTIEKSAFRDMHSLESITVGENNQNYSDLDGVLFDKNRETLIQYPSGKTETSYTIPDGVTEISDGTFSRCRNLTAVTIPDGVTDIGEEAFFICSALTGITIPVGVSDLKDHTFFACSLLESVIIPDSVTSIGLQTFSGCDALADVYYGGTVEQWNAVTIRQFNEPLTEATLYYNSTGEYEEGVARTVTFDAAGGTVEPTEKAVTAGQAYGELPEPAREHYAFAGWHTTRNGGTEVSADDTALLSGDVTLYAHWTPLPYTVTWADEDGTVLQTAEVPYGQTPVYSGETPVKDEDELFLYVFAGWTPEVGPVGGDTAYTVRYDSVSKFCTVTWYNYNGEVLETDENVPLGETPEYNGETPERLPAGANAYVFAGWTPEVVAVSGDAAYMATYEAAPRTLTVTWVDEDGTVLETDEVSYGETPVYNGEAPVKATDERYDYEFSGWKTLPRPIRDDMTYEAAYTPTPKKYTITWLDEDDTPLGTTQVQYGRVPAYDGERPRREAGEKPYIFAGWTPKPEPVSGEATYKARYRPSVSASVESVAIEDGAVNATLDCSETDASLLCAIYNENDRLITLASLPVGEEKLYSFRFDGHEFEYAKVFAIDANARALCASVKCEKAGDPLPEIE